MEQEPRQHRPLLSLGERQQTAVAAALTILAAAVILCTVLGLGWLAAIFVQRFSHVFLPLAVGAIGALVFRPYFQLLHTRLKIPSAVALILLLLSITIPLVAFGWFFGSLAFEQLSDLVTSFPETWRKAQQSVQDRWPQVVNYIETHPWAQQLKTAVQEQQGTIVSGLQQVGGKALSAGGAVFRGFGTLFAWAVLPVYFIFFLMADWKPDRGLHELLPFLKPQTRKDVVYLATEFVNIVVAFFRGQLIIAFLQGLLYAIGFSAVGLRYGFVLGLLLGLLNIIPYLGSIIGLGIGLPLGFFQQGGGTTVVVGVLVVFTVVQLIESYVLTPRIMGDRTGLHPMVIIVAVFFWGSALNGIMGMILAIPLTAFLVVFWRLARERYISELL